MYQTIWHAQLSEMYIIWTVANVFKQLKDFSKIYEVRVL